MGQTYDFTVSSVGTAKIPSPIRKSIQGNDFITNYVSESERIFYDISASLECTTKTYSAEELIEVAGPREKIFFDPSKVHAAIVTCGGLCPGLNSVIRSIVMGLWHQYGVRRISGIRYGYRGLIPEFKIPTIELNPEIVSRIHTEGGTMLGSSRGFGDRVSDIVDSLESMNINMFFTIGGDGTQRGALAVADESTRRGNKISVIGIPKTIDNDFRFVQKSFGFETAVSYAVQAVENAHTEAHDSLHGVGIVKVMGRESGFIAAHTSLATNDVNYVLIPEVPFDLNGPRGLLEDLKKRLETRNHAVILIAEGAGQDLMPARDDNDASGNKKLNDVGIFLQKQISDFFKSKNIEINMKYIDPSYMIRRAAPNPNDSIYCARLGNNAVHAAMAGKTKIIIGMTNYVFVHLPTRLAVERRNKVDPESPLWRDVLETTGQPPLMKN